MRVLRNSLDNIAAAFSSNDSQGSWHVADFMGEGEEGRTDAFMRVKEFIDNISSEYL